jgi:hypothetical protein
MLAHFWETAERRILGQADSPRTITAVCHVEWVARPDPRERYFHQRFLLLTTRHQGTAFYDDIPVEPAGEIVGVPVSEGRRLSVPVQVALLDSLYEPLRRGLTPSRSLTIDGVMADKAAVRASFICDEAVRLLGEARLKAGRPLVSLVGVSTLQSRLLSERGFQVQAWDRNPSFLGEEIVPGTRVQFTDDPDEQVRAADVVLVSGMTLAGGTLPGIISACLRHGSKIVVWAVTGSNLAPWYRDFGVDSVIAEVFPFYFLSGPTQVDCFRRS